MAAHDGEFLQFACGNGFANLAAYTGRLNARDRSVFNIGDDGIMARTIERKGAEKTL